MAIDVFHDQILTMTEAARMVPPLRAGRPVHGSTLWRWTSRGLRGIRLETVLLGGTRVTSTEALRRFFAELSATPAVSPVPLPLAMKEVEKNLDALGI